MKIIINIDESLYDAINQDIYINGMRSGKTLLQKLVASIVNGTPITDNASNGDVLKAIFKPNRITRTDDTVHINYDITPEWWNAPYQ